MIILEDDMMKTSVIIPNYNGQEYLKVCLDALKRQTFKNMEIIIVDNNSEDKSCKIIKENHPEVKLIQLEKNFGFSKAVNKGIKVSSGKYVVLLNNDTEATEDWLERLVNCIDKDEKTFSCSSKMIQYDNRNKIDDAGDELTVMGWAYKRGDKANMDKYQKTEEVFSSCAGAAIYRKKIFEEIGYFDEEFFAYLEDIDICYRAKIHGYKNVYCSDAKVYHVGSATSGSRYNSFKVRLAARNNIYLIYKNMPFLQLLLNSPFIILGWMIKFLFFWQKGLGKDYLDGIKSGIKGIKNVKKISFRNDRLCNYIKIEIELIKNTFNYIFSKLFSGVM